MGLGFSRPEEVELGWPRCSRPPPPFTKTNGRSRLRGVSAGLAAGGVVVVPTRRPPPAGLRGLRRGGPGLRLRRSAAVVATCWMAATASRASRSRDRRRMTPIRRRLGERGFLDSLERRRTLIK